MFHSTNRTRMKEMVKIKDNSLTRDIFSERNVLFIGLVRQKTCQRRTIINEKINDDKGLKQNNILRQSRLNLNKMFWIFKTFICCMLI